MQHVPQFGIWAQVCGVLVCQSGAVGMVGLAPRRFAMLKVARGTCGSGMAVLPARSGLKMFRVEGRVQNRNMNRSEVLAVKLLHVLVSSA